MTDRPTGAAMIAPNEGRGVLLDDEEAAAKARGLSDETVGPGGRGVREHWRTFLDGMDAIGLDEVRRRWEDARRLIRENGITYNVYGDPRGQERPWELDPIPLLIDPDEAAVLESGLVQRGRLLEAILTDLYGPQILLTEGLLPPDLVFGHPGFLRPCRGLSVPGGRRLHLYAVDLGRAPDGKFRVLRDRTQAPSGAGYALENRIVLSRMLPEPFRDCRVRRLAPFFQGLRESLRAIAPGSPDEPRVVLLTPGPYNETYFEHAFLARYLGYTLAEGADLTVRDGRVFLKLLGGLRPVDVILRRVDDDYCDPLELRGDSFLGVPGLLGAVRAGTVAVANALGTGLVETPALLAYLPGLCRRLLGEDLAIPSVATHWCGEPGSLDRVLADLSRMVIRPTFPATGSSPVFAARLDAGGLRALADLIRARPGDYVGQEELTPSQAPALVGDGLRSRPVLVRAFLAAKATGGSFGVMQGGLTRVASGDDPRDVSMQRGGGSKDTWVLSKGPVPPFSLLQTTGRPVRVSRDGGDLPSRAADDLFWLGRYAERAEGIVRLLRAVFVRLTETQGLVDAPELPCLLRALTETTRTYPGFVGQGGAGRLASPLDTLDAVVHDPGLPGGLAGTVDGLLRVAARVRDRVSTDLWRTITGLGPRPGQARDPSETLQELDRMVLGLAAFGGLVAESMTRGQSWRFLDMGRRLERSLGVLGLLRSTLVAPNPAEGPLLDALLEIADSSMTYRRRYMSGLQVAPLLDLLLLDEDNPRSLAFQLVALSRSVALLPLAARAGGPSPEESLIADALTGLRRADVEALVRVTPSGHRVDFERFLALNEAELPLLSESLTRSYLAHLRPSRQGAVYVI